MFLSRSATATEECEYPNSNLRLRSHPSASANDKDQAPGRVALIRDSGTGPAYPGCLDRLVTAPHMSGRN